MKLATWRDLNVADPLPALGCRRARPDELAPTPAEWASPAIIRVAEGVYEQDGRMFTAFAENEKANAPGEMKYAGTVTNRWTMKSPWAESFPKEGALLRGKRAHLAILDDLGREAFKEYSKLDANTFRELYSQSPKPARTFNYGGTQFDVPEGATHFHPGAEKFCRAQPNGRGIELWGSRQEWRVAVGARAEGSNGLGSSRFIPLPA